MKYRRMTDIFGSPPEMDFSPKPELNTLLVLKTLLSDDKFTGSIKLSDDDLKQRAAIFVHDGLCVGGSHCGKSVELIAFDQELVKAFVGLAKSDTCRYEAYRIDAEKILAYSALFRGYPGEEIRGEKFLDAWKLQSDFCAEKDVTGCFTVVTPICTALLPVHKGKQLGIFIPEQQIWLEDRAAIAEFMEAASVHGIVALSSLPPDLKEVVSFKIDWN